VAAAFRSSRFFVPYGVVAWVAGMVENLPIVESFNGVKISQYKVSFGLDCTCSVKCYIFGILTLLLRMTL